MATNGSVRKAVTSYDTLVFEWNISSQDIANNRSVVAWSLKLVASGYGAISSSANKSWSVTVNGTNYSGTNTVGISNNSTKTLASGTTTIGHNADGTKTFNFSFSQQFGISFSGSSIGTVSGSGSGTLTTIPRASSLTASNGTLGVAQTLSINRASSGFAHTITYSCGSYSGTLVTKTSNTSVSFTPNIEWAVGAPNGDKVYISLIIQTFNGNTLIGSKTHGIWASIPASVLPTISGVVISEGSGDVPSGFPYVQGKSKLVIKTTASGVYNSTIQKCVVEAGGVSYSGLNVTTNVIKQSGSVNIKVIVTDSRGRMATKSVTVTVVEYLVPRVSASVIRCNSSGIADDDGEYMKVTYTMTISSLNNKNTKAYGVRYRKESVANFTDENISASTYSVSGSVIKAADSGSSFVIECYAKDSFTEVHKTLNLATGYTIFNIRANGKGIRFGGVAERDGFEISQDFFIDGCNTMYQPVSVPNGTDFDTLITNGWYSMNSNASTTDNTNMPRKVAFVMGVFPVQASMKIQLFFCYDGTAVYQRYYRTWEPVGWTEWEQIGGKNTIVETGRSTTGNARWHYKKYTDGTMEVFGGMDVTKIACTTALGGWYRTEVLTPTNYPVAFSSAPEVVMSFSTSANTGAMVWQTTGSEVAKAPNYYLIRPTTANEVSGRVSIYAKGRWKE